MTFIADLQRVVQQLETNHQQQGKLLQGLKQLLAQQSHSPLPAALVPLLDAAPIAPQAIMPNRSLEARHAAEPRSKALTDIDLIGMAVQLDISAATLKAVRDVATSGRSGFLPDGRPAVQFEGQLFWKQLRQQGIDLQEQLADNEDLLYPSWNTQYHKRCQQEHDRLNRAIQINRAAALAATSWGMFQLMGSQYSACGYTTVEAFVDSQHQSERHQLQAFANLLRSTHTLDALRRNDWVWFANSYFGPDYASRRLDTKLADAYRRYQLAQAI